jgi:hypothetical protein
MWYLIIEGEFCLWARADCEIERRGERRVLTKYEEARERPLQYAQRFGAFFESTIEILKGKCEIESSVGTERIE